MTAAPAVATGPSPRPYPGLRPFARDEGSIFFGREQAVDEVIKRLLTNRLVLVHGVPGSGKSSLVRAGVLPRLARQHGRRDAPWLSCDTRPSGGLLWNLAVEFARLEGRADDAERVRAIAGQFNARSATLASVAASLEGMRGKSLCLLIDQFEELLRFDKEAGRDEAELFVGLVERVAAEGGEQAAPEAVNLHVIVTMRSEFLGECARFAGFVETFNRTQYFVPPMNDDEMIRAVRQPAQANGCGIREGLAERLVALVRGRGEELPLLQHGLMLMWEDALRRANGGAALLDGAIVDEAGGLAGLLSSHADRIMAAAAPDERRRGIVDAVFRALTEVNGHGAPIRRPRAFRDLCAFAGATQDELRPILDEFRAPGASFLTPYAPAPLDDRTLIDISRDAIIRCWRWIDPIENIRANRVPPTKAPSKPRKATRRCYVSYAWSDRSDPDREAKVDWLCDEAKNRGVKILRDKTTLAVGDVISEFMQRLGKTDRCSVFLSDKYLKSPFCMFELFELWRRSEQDRENFLDRVRVFCIGEVKIYQPEERLVYSKYWKVKRQELFEKMQEVGQDAFGDDAYKRYRLMLKFSNEVADLLAIFADTVQPRTFEDFLEYRFEDPPARRPAQLAPR
jgi:TIR domain